jgi:hypothetical protein
MRQAEKELVCKLNLFVQRAIVAGVSFCFPERWFRGIPECHKSNAEVDKSGKSGTV